jgi:hypothetical protein
MPDGDMTYDDAWQDPSMKAWAKQVLDDAVPKIKDSVLVAQLVPDGPGDVKSWVELGASIMLDKPIVAVVLGDRPVPEKLRLVADEIVRLPEGVNAEGSDELAAAFERVLDRG